jgi:DNA replication protein DnaC
MLAPAGEHRWGANYVRQQVIQWEHFRRGNAHLLILDDLAYVHKSQAETSVLFELIAARYERRSMLITANQPFKDWGNVFPDPAMTVAAIDRLVHHSVIFEMNVESYRQRTAQGRKPKPTS